MINHKIDMRSKVALKFIMSKLKRLIVDRDGRSNYMENLDELLKDIFGVKNFTKKLDSCYDDRETVAIVNEIGLKNLMTICNTPRIYDAISEMVIMNNEIHKISKIVKKLERKGKNKERKGFEKEYEYLVETYRKAVKTLRKTFGTKKPSYKKKFRSVSNLLDRKGFSYHDDDSSVSSVFYDDSDSFYDDDDDDFDSDENEFERYLNKVLKEDKKKEVVGRRGTKKSRPSIDMEDDDDDDFDSSDDDDNDIESRVDTMSGKLDTITAALQALINTSSSNSNRPVINNNTLPNTDVSELNKSIMYLAKCQKESVVKQNDIISILSDMLDGEEMEEEDDGFRAVINDSDPRIDPYRQNSAPDLTKLSKDDLINFINQNHNQLQRSVPCTDDIIIEPRISSD